MPTETEQVVLDVELLLLLLKLLDAGGRGLYNQWTTEMNATLQSELITVVTLCAIPTWSNRSGYTTCTL